MCIASHVFVVLGILRENCSIRINIRGAHMERQKRFRECGMALAYAMNIDKY